MNPALSLFNLTAERPRESRAISRWDIAGLVLVLVAAAILRLSYPEIIDYRQDQADLASLAQNLAEGKSVPLLGIPSSAGFPNSPMTVYVIAIPFLISDSPVFVTMFIAALNVAGVGLLWYITRRYASPRTALLASLTYAVSPWAVGYSRSIWAQDYHTPIFLLGLLFGLYGFVEGKRWAQIVCLPVMVIAMQIHFVAWLYVPIYLWLVWTGRRRVSVSALVISFFLAALTLLPFVLGVAQAIIADPNAFAGVQAQQRELSVRNLIKPYGQMIWIATGLGTEQYSARPLADAMLAAIGIPTPIWLPLLGFLLLGVITLVTSKERWFAVFVLLWAFFPMLVFTIPVVDVVAHYFVPSIPAVCLIIAIGADRLLRLSGPNQAVLRPVILIVLAVIFLTQGIFTLRAQTVLDQNYAHSQFGSGPSIQRLFPVQSALRDYEDVVLIGSGDWIDISAHGAAVWSSLLRHSATCTRDLSVSQNFVVLPDGPFAAVLTPRTTPPLLFEALYQTDNPTVIGLRPNEGEYQIYAFEQPPVWTGQPLTAIAPVTFQNGVSLNGYRLDEGRVTLEWTLPAATTRNFDYAISFADADQGMLDQQTFSFWPGENWCAGDRLISWQDIQIPDTAATVYITMRGVHDPASESFAEIALS